MLGKPFHVLDSHRTAEPAKPLFVGLNLELMTLAISPALVAKYNKTQALLATIPATIVVGLKGNTLVARMLERRRIF